MSILTAVILIIVGLIACFFGKQYFRIIMGLQGFAVGYYIMTRLLSEQGETIALVGGVIVGLILAIAFYQFLYKFAVVVFGALLGIMIVGLIEVVFGLGGTVALIGVLIGAVLGAVVGNAVADTIIELSTSISGAAQTIGGVAALIATLGIAIPLADPTAGGAGTDSLTGIVTLVATAVLAVIGFVFQARSNQSIQ